ncbi:MAG TPA: HPP family protein [Thiobacillus sp.]|jgi:CBS-domain-containing membrane protein|nr:HPP family protein [Thiobacillus sp.]
MVRKLAYSVSEREHWISAAGGLFGILVVLWVGHVWIGSHAGMLAIASMGSTAVLLFAAPHGAMSQPWPVFGGHMVSALVGVSCVRWLGDDTMLTASLAVALSIAAMYSLRCLHPPGGATAMYAVLGGETVHALGYGYLFSPVLLNVMVLLAVAVVFNYPFAWRRYPQMWWHQALVCEPSATVTAGSGEKCMIPHSDLVYALSQIDTFIDISEEDLQKIYALALGHHQHAAETAGQMPELAVGAAG